MLVWALNGKPKIMKRVCRVALQLLAKCESVDPRDLFESLYNWAINERHLNFTMTIRRRAINTYFTLSQCIHNGKPTRP